VYGEAAVIRALLENARAGRPDGETRKPTVSTRSAGRAVALEDGGPSGAHRWCGAGCGTAGGPALRSGYVEGVAVLADRRGRGATGAVTAEAARVIRAGYGLGALDGGRACDRRDGDVRGDAESRPGVTGPCGTCPSR
jgi:aminoglycoside 2'-N-acetyltransferase I